jgi:hypothetical protein
MDEVGAAVDRLTGDVKAAYTPAPQTKAAPLPANASIIDRALNAFAGGQSANAGGERAAAADRVLSDLIDVPNSFIRGVTKKYVNKPLSSATGIPEDVIGAAETAGVMALGNRMGSPGVAREVPAPNAFAAAAARPPGPVARVVAPFAARFSDKAAAEQAGARIAGRASDLPAVRANLAQGPAEIVPGSMPTTFQQTGDVGLGAFERELATAPGGPEQFAQRRADQNSARVSSLNGIQAGADPVDVAKTLRGHFDTLDAQTQAEVSAATQAAQQRGAGIGGNDTPEGYGERTRAAVTAAEDAARAREGALWRAIDPEGNLTGNVSQTKAAAQQIQSSLAGTAKPMAGEEAAIFQTAQDMPALAPVSDLIALRSRLSAEMRNELIANGRSPAYARLSQLRGEIQDNLSTSIAHQVQQDDGAVARGMMPAEQAISAKINSWVDEHRARKNEAAGGYPQGDPAGYAGAGSGAIRGPDRAAGDTGGGVGRLAGDQGVQGGQPAPNTPTFDDEAAGRLSAATDATKQRAATFGVSPVSQVTATQGTQGQFRLPNGQVPGRFFHSGQNGFEHMQAALRASPEAQPILEDYAAMSLRRAAMRDDGTLDPAKLTRWRDAHQDALRALPPETVARFTDASAASEALAEAAQNRTAALANAQQGAIGRVMGLTEPQDVTRTIGSVLGGRTSVADMKSLWNATKGDENARAGLRQAVADHILNKYIGNTEAVTSGVNQIKADGFQTFIRQNRAALTDGFTPEELNRMEAIAADIQRAKRSEQAVRMPGNSNSAQDILATTKNATAKGGRSLLNTIFAGIGLHAGGLATAIPAALGADLIQGLRQAGIERVDQLVTRAMLDPAVARSLLEVMPPPARNAPRVASAAEQRRNAALVRALTVGTAASAAAPPKAQPQPGSRPNAFLGN